MKQKLLVIICLFFTIKSFSQAYIPFQFGNTRWAYMKTNTFGSTSYFYFSKDTNGIYYNGNKYWKIEKQTSPTYTPSTSYWYIFDDTLSRKVYCYSNSSGLSYLLYDFSANVGDTINSVGNPVAIDTVIVDSIKFISSNSIIRKHIYLHSIRFTNPQTKIWIEGIGSTYDLFYPTITLPDPLLNLICYQYNSYTLYPDSINGTNACNNFLTSVNNIENNLFNIYPNPTQNTIHITANTITPITSYKLYNSIGSLIQNNKLKNNTIDISSLSTGIYYLQLQTDKTTQTTKIIKE